MISRFILFLVLLPVFLFIFHVLVARLLAFLKISVSSQKLLVRCIIFLNVPVLLLSSVILGFQNKNILAGNLYALLVFNSFAYFYFCFFHMSETARRIKILMGIRKYIIKSKDDIGRCYDSGIILNNRLKLLEQLSQIEKRNDGTYILKGNALYIVSYLVIFWRSILGFKD